ncbi:MAG: MFS transporter [Solirubrobacterales bacterium]
MTLPAGAGKAGVTVAFVGIFMATMLNMLAVGALLPVLPLYVRGPLGEGDLAVGIVIGAYALTGVAFRPLAGFMADRRGRRWVVVVGSIVSAVAGALLFLPLGLAAVLASRLVLGAGEGSVFTAGSAWVADVAPKENRARLIGIYGLAIWSGLSIGPAVGQALMAAGGFKLVWLLVFTLPILSAVIAAGTREAYTVPTHLSGTGRGQSLISREALGPGISMALVSAGFAAMASFVILHMRDQGVAGGAWVFTAFAVSLVVARIIAGGLPDRLGPRRVAVVAALLEAIGLSVIGLAGTLPVALAGAVVMGWAFSVLYPSLSLIVLRRVPDSRRGAAFGTFTATFDLGVALGAPLVGLVITFTNYSSGFVFAAGLAMAVAAIQAVLIFRESRGAATAS